ncbi:hypothetical protein CEE37_02325 [candidate division LCP-89 bacterium B3_LCP]|uniref:Secretion system C-terminal sorting domain-containing protein n=1 Tax=candidate division LCP-89 bacterium B3_LCP TaxID=2012998 RepID=A0A532V5R9_UNCL8|nr:MAG: hypothetical protein CEE37_02325 [candidate division LCP-89 bacterium B3_LCP]
MEHKNTTVRLLLIASIMLFACTSMADDQIGVTGIDPTIPDRPVIHQPARIGSPLQVDQYRHVDYLSPWFDQTDDWELIASDSFSVMIPAGDHLAVSFDPGTEILQIIDPTVELTATQMAAIERAPAWLRSDLYDNFRRFLYPFLADSMALRILGAPDPYVDEVAFQVAHIAPTTLCAMYYQLFLENAQWIYTADSSLNYVELMDYGNSNDDDYWTTARYSVIEEIGDTVQVEIDREIYYWYILHPKLSDEFPTYIYPENGNPAQPPWGVFWRDYLWNHADPGYPLLSEQFDDCDFLWARGTGPNDAIGTVNGWVGDVMAWGAGPERPIQPVRIYVLHCGNCGEYSDIRAAAGRIALIPTVCTTNFCEDHVWNEFWEREWIHWDGGSVNTPLMYENSWGKTLSAVFNWRGDGFNWNVTDRYSEEFCTLNVSVYDSAGKPADGYSITVESDALWGGSFYATWAVTNSQGVASIILGDDQSFMLRLDGPLGGYPSVGGLVSVITGSQAGAAYNWEHTMSSASPNLGVMQMIEPPNPDDDYMMEITFDCEYESTYGMFYDNNEFTEKLTPGYVDFFFADEENYNAYCGFQQAWVGGPFENSSSGEFDFVIPTSEEWYGVFSAREESITCPMVSGTVNIYRSLPTSVSCEDYPTQPLSFDINGVFPNPFNNETVISFSLPSSERIRIAIYNLLGQEVATLTDQIYAGGMYNVRWDGRNDLGHMITSGIYLVRMNSEHNQAIQKICYMR